MNIPILDNDGNEQTYGKEFENLYKDNLKGNLQIPQDPVIDYNTGQKYTLYDNTGGIYNQSKLYENNNDPNEDQQVTDQQAMERIRNSANINRPLTEDEKRFNLYTTNSFDIRFTNQLVRESLSSGSNLFSEFSQDHVNALRESNENQFNEQNLYISKSNNVNLLANLLKQQQIEGKKEESNTLVDLGIQTLMDLAKKEQKVQEEQQKFRDTAVGKTSETMSQKFEKITALRNSVPSPLQSYKYGFKWY